MNWRGKRRTIVVLIVLAFLTLFVFVPIAIINYDPPSCFDGEQNQTETGVDCGGTCVIQCVAEVKPIKILWTRLYEVRPGVYSALAYVENQNFNIASRKIPYTVRVFDSTGKKITEKYGQTFALPNERFAVFEGGLTTGSQVPSRVEIEFETSVKWVSFSTPLPKMSVTDKILTDADAMPKLTAMLQNEAEATIRNIYVTAVIYDAKNEPIAGSATVVEALSPDSSEKLTFTWPKALVYDAELESCAQPVDVILALDRSGSMSSDQDNPPEPLTQAKEAASDFVSRMTAFDQVGFVSFATEASVPIDQELSAQKDAVKKIIESVVIRKDGVQYTNIGAALLSARNEFLTQRKNPDAKQVVVLLTDGAPTFPKDPINPNYPEIYAREVASALKADGVTVYTIGLGAELKEQLLRDLATSPEQYYPAATGADLAGVYQSIATSICKKAPSVIEVIPRINNVPE